MKNYRLNKSREDANHSESYWIKGPGLWNKHTAWHTFAPLDAKDKDGYPRNVWTHAEVLDMLERAYEAGKDAEHYNPRKKGA